MGEIPISSSSGPSNLRSTSIALLSGASAGILSDGITFPISTAKSRLQVSGSSASTILTMKSIVRSEGWLALYSGFGTVAVAAPARAVYFGAYETAKRECGNLLNIKDPNSPVINFAAGGFAQLTGSLLWVPMELIKERLQVQSLAHQSEGNVHIPKTNYSSSGNAVKTILREEGVRGLYRGYFAHQLVWTPFNAFYFMVYGMVKGATMKFYEKPGFSQAAVEAALPFYVFPCAGAIAGAASAAVTAPIDLVKTRLQTQGDAKLYSSSYDCVKKILKNEGVSALTRGTVARMLWLSPNVMITMSIYEAFKQFFGVEPI